MKLIENREITKARDDIQTASIVKDLERFTHIFHSIIEWWVERSYFKLRAISTTPSDFRATKDKIGNIKKIPRR